MNIKVRQIFILSCVKNFLNSKTFGTLLSPAFGEKLQSFGTKKEKKAAFTAVKKIVRKYYRMLPNIK